MQPVQLTNPTRRLGALDNWNHETDGLCRTLDIIDNDGYMHSFWQPTAMELARLINGGYIELAIAGTVHPVISLAVTMPDQTDDNK